MRKRSKPKLSVKSTQSFCPVLAVRDGVIITKDFRYAKLMEIAPVSFELRSRAEQDAVISSFVSALKTMPDTLHFKIVNTPSDTTPFIDELIECMQKEKDPGCRELQYDQMQLIHKTASARSVRRRFFLSFEYESTGGATSGPDFEKIRRLLNEEERAIRASLESCGNTVVSSDEDGYILDTLYTLMCRGTSSVRTFEERESEVRQRFEKRYGREVPFRDIPAADIVSPSRIDFGISPAYALVDGKYTIYCFIPSDAYPLMAYGGWTRTLFTPFEGTDIDLWIKKEDCAKTSRRLSYELKSNRIREKNTDDISGSFEGIESALSSGYYFKSALASGDCLCYMAILLTITGDTLEEAEEKYREIRDHLTRCDLKMRTCLFQQDRAYLSCLPFGRCDSVLFGKSRRNVALSQLGSCYPFTSCELCDPGGIFFGVNTKTGSPVFINIFDRSKYQNANMLILGPSGSGKTYTLLSMLLRMRQKGLQVFVIAPYKGNEFARACSAVGGEFIRIAPGSAQNINIMEIRKYDSGSVLIDGQLYGSSSILTSKVQQLERFFSMLVRDITVGESQILDDALMETYRDFGITEDNDSLIDPEDRRRYRRMPVLRDLYGNLSGKGESAARLTQALSRYVTGSASSFSRDTNVNLENSFVVLDVSEMTNEFLSVGMFITLDYVLDAARSDRTVNKVIAIDEMWRLMSASSLTAEFTVEVFKIIRGYGGAAVGATQDLDDVLKDESGAAIINNAKIKLFLPMERKEADAVSNIVDLSSAELKQLKSSVTVRPGSERSLLMTAGEDHAFISIKTSAKEHDLITTNADDLKRIAKASPRLGEVDRNAL